MKPFAPKTIEKKYASLGLSKETIDLLHAYYLCFANLYGVISVGDAWNVFKHYEGSKLLRKKDFIAASGIVQREADHPYTVLELKQAYKGETTDDPAERLIVNNRLIGTGLRKYVLLYNTEDMQGNKPYYLPAEKAMLMAFVEDRFFLSEEGKQMVRFLGGLKTGGKYKTYDGVPRGDILDTDGNPAGGRRLSDFVFYTQEEQFEIGFVKSDAKKEKLRQEYKKTALDKMLDLIFIEIQTGGYRPEKGMGNTLKLLFEFLDRELGADLTRAQYERFLKLYTDLNNHSNLWLNCGWQPVELGRRSPHKGPAVIYAGPNMKKMFEDGTLDRAEYEKELASLGIRLIVE
ncbi:MAG: hypothetical protein IKD89_00985 [Clostridia bacterium]|nr:hypothetical protein [Clostridia bacterium]